PQRQPPGKRRRQPLDYSRKVKTGEEPPAANRPAADRFGRRADGPREVAPDAPRLYDLIWKRCVASQMADARGRRVSLRLGATSTAGEAVLFSASGKTITFAGFLRAYVEGSDDPDAELEDREVRLPALEQGEAVANTALEAAGHATQPPSRYTEASLVAELEARGIGRPSTYASVIQTIQDRGYVWKKGPALVPSWTAFAVIRLLEEHFAHLVDYAFTARMEESPDDLTRAMADERLERGAEEGRALGNDPDTGLEITVRDGRYGPYVQLGEQEEGSKKKPKRASLFKTMIRDSVTLDEAMMLLSLPRLV